MSAETRNSSALFKRAEQLRRWEDSETNRESLVPHKKTKIQFSSGCVFLAACAAGEKDEVLRLIEKGADIDTANVDGLTALHQACIDDHLEMVEFLVENGADVNRGDNEGWTPLHATASCGFISIARYLLENGANVAAVNNDGDLPIDIAESEEMEHVLQQCILDQGIDAEEARNEEERLMLRDAKEWQTNGRRAEPSAHPVTGATALHVAAAKGYTKVMRVLLQCNADVNAQDKDGWTPLHAAAHWGQVEASEMLVYNNCNMDLQNYVGQTAFDVADSEMNKTLEELRRERSEIIVTKNINTPKRRSPPQRIDKLPLNNREIEEAHVIDDINNKMKKVESELEAHEPIRQVVGTGDLDVERSERESSPESSESSETSTESDSESASDAVEEDNKEARASELEAEKKNRVNEANRIPSSPSEVKKSVPNLVPPSPTKAPPPEPVVTAPTATQEDPSAWRRSGSLRTRTANGREDTSVPANSLRIVEKDTPAIPSSNVPTDSIENQEVVLRRTRSFECDEKFFRRYKELHDRINAGSCPTLNSQATPNFRSASLREKYLNRVREEPSTPSKQTSPAAASPTTAPLRSGPGAGSTPSTPTSPGGSKLSPSNIFKQFFKSIVPPVRDEESETQRKAHAKRVRETRRSTQGVTLEEIKSAEQLVKKKNAAAAAAAASSTPTTPSTNSSTEQASNTNPSPSALSSPPAAPSVAVSAETTTEESATSATAVVATSSSPGNHERRPSWRLRVDNGDRSKFLLEDARRTGDQAASATVTYTRRSSASGTPPTVRPNSTPVEPSTTNAASGTTDASVTVSLKRNSSKNLDDKDQDKENDSRGAQATQAVIQRRRRPKRRSTGVVHLDMDEIDPERQDASKDEPVESDWSGRSSRLNSSVGAGGDSLGSSRATTPANAKEDNSTENGEPDYKRLYEESQLENERLREKLKKTEGELKEYKSKNEKASSQASKATLSELEKRERRSLERKLAEMEEELKNFDAVRTENQRLKDENGALIRVISKLSK